MISSHTHTHNLEFLTEKVKLSPSYVQTCKFYTDSTINLWKLSEDYLLNLADQLNSFPQNFRNSVINGIYVIHLFPDEFYFLH